MKKTGKSYKPSGKSEERKDRKSRTGMNGSPKKRVTEASSPGLVMATLSLRLGSNLQEFLMSRTPTLKTQMRPSLSNDYDNHVFFCLLFLLDHETYEM